ncbi:uncharacterized protein LOC135209480 [Macrobrachium nipponense]|uniref:uncharacterized protein LOC135209480 n=1 Tax=Macrobrachium nipponense TaxID=159736 RepID=UPI0030C8AD37
MVQVSRLLVILFLISLTSAQSDSAVQTTSNGQTAVFRLPNSVTGVVGYRTEHLWPLINYTVSYQGKIIGEKALKSLKWKSQWMPLLKLPKEINGTNLEDPQGLDTRNVSLSSNRRGSVANDDVTSTDHELQKATPGEEVLLDLPEEDDVWVAVWNELGREIRTELSLFHEQEKYLHLNINVSQLCGSFMEMILVV